MCYSLAGLLGRLVEQRSQIAEEGHFNDFGTGPLCCLHTVVAVVVV